MCDIERTKERDTVLVVGEKPDVDDLIFRDEQEWLVSDR